MFLARLAHQPGPRLASGASLWDGVRAFASPRCFARLGIRRPFSRNLDGDSDPSQRIDYAAGGFSGARRVRPPARWPSKGRAVAEHANDST